MFVKAVIHNSFSKEWLCFEKPAEIIQTNELPEVLKTLDYLQEKCFEGNYYAAGFISYDASPAFDYALKVKDNENKNVPLLLFVLCEKVRKIQLPKPGKSSKYFGEWYQTVSKVEYRKAIEKVKKHIQAGDTYQVNYTMRQYAEFFGDYWEFFCELACAQRSQYAAFIETDDFVVCSASPELFFTYDKGTVISKPMKGTAPRGFTYEEDMEKAEYLHHSEKNRAENVMIVDMIRNDLSKISEPHSVKVPVLFEAEKFPTVWQMTSTVSSYTKKSLLNVFKAFFPCASITGAPKPYTMKIISEVESTSRGLYTGAIGFIEPTKKAQFNVAIRTVVIDKITKIAEYGVGGGIVWDSTAEDEYEECLVKTKFLSSRQADFSILESILWTSKEGYFLLNYHLERMKKSASYFNYEFDNNKVVSELKKLSASLEKSSYKIRILLDEKGILTLEPQQIFQENVFKTIKVVISDKPVNTNIPFVYHKTTNRKHYDEIRSRFQEYDEVIFWNQKSEITEGSCSNVVIKIKDELFTPPVNCGLLGGTFRQYLLDKGEIKEKVIKLEELVSADEIYLINSVRKWRRAFI